MDKEKFYELQKSAAKQDSGLAYLNLSILVVLFFAIALVILNKEVTMATFATFLTYFLQGLAVGLLVLIARLLNILVQFKVAECRKQNDFWNERECEETKRRAQERKR